MGVDGGLGTGEIEKVMHEMRLEKQQEWDAYIARRDKRRKDVMVLHTAIQLVCTFNTFEDEDRCKKNKLSAAVIHCCVHQPACYCRCVHQILAACRCGGTILRDVLQVPLPPTTAVHGDMSEKQLRQEAATAQQDTDVSIYI